MRLFRILTLPVLFLMLACGDDATNDTGHYGEGCADDADCTAPLTCGTSGWLYGLCQLPCTTDSECSAALTPAYQCSDLAGACVVRCTTPMACSGEDMVAECPGETTCQQRASVGDCTLDFCQAP